MDHLDSVRASPPIDGLKGHWSVSRRGPEPRWFFGDPALLARDNIHITRLFGSMANADLYITRHIEK